jgi:hypothetical protein
MKTPWQAMHWSKPSRRRGAVEDLHSRPRQSDEQVREQQKQIRVEAGQEGRAFKPWELE